MRGSLLVGRLQIQRSANQATVTFPMIDGLTDNAVPSANTSLMLPFLAIQPDMQRKRDTKASTAISLSLLAEEYAELRPLLRQSSVSLTLSFC